VPLKALGAKKVNFYCILHNKLDLKILILCCPLNNAQLIQISQALPLLNNLEILKLEANFDIRLKSVEAIFQNLSTVKNLKELNVQFGGKTDLEEFVETTLKGIRACRDLERVKIQYWKNDPDGTKEEYIENFKNEMKKELSKCNAFLDFHFY